MNNPTLLLALLVAASVTACQQPQPTPPPPAADYLLLVQNPSTDQQGYRSTQGEMVIPLGRYPICQTDTFRTYAVVLSGVQWVAIDREEKVLYEIYPFDNGPDYPAEGLFRIRQNGKIGYANAATGTVVVPAQFDGAFPFENGKARVGIGCKTVSDGEHSTWEGGEWHFIDRTGKRVE